eukprot:CAMPEP_0183711358 /NCGR_PEP_ID=MMETSP0737-20130205/6885_1 /TAXON_ID=385413 /ORGANISM="Thalassiosira miniscula, Strain CCMP1093" /LENGTH=142 /DNA_ID=CAMNT_0025939851 /DNA_START=496 /DNA_END=924 /DNA_ORIENTATION=-
MTILQWLEVLIVRFILEVVGAVGAIWGCSEILRLRDNVNNAYDSTNNKTTTWRAISIAIGVIFLARWMRQLRTFGRSERDKEPKTVAKTQIGLARDTSCSEEIEEFDVGRSDLELTVATDIMESLAETASMEVSHETTMEIT